MTMISKQGVSKSFVGTFSAGSRSMVMDLLLIAQAVSQHAVARSLKIIVPHVALDTRAYYYKMIMLEFVSTQRINGDRSLRGRLLNPLIVAVSIVMLRFVFLSRQRRGKTNRNSNIQIVLEPPFPPYGTPCSAIPI